MKTILKFLFCINCALFYDLSLAQTLMVEGLVVLYEYGFDHLSPQCLPGIQLKANWNWFPTETDKHGHFKIYAMDVISGSEARIELQSDSLFVANPQDLNNIQLDQEDFLIIYAASKKDLPSARIELFETGVGAFWAWRDSILDQLNGPEAACTAAIEALGKRWDSKLSSPEQAKKLLQEESRRLVNLLPIMGRRLKAVGLDEAATLCDEAHSYSSQKESPQALATLKELRESRGPFRLALQQLLKKRYDKAKEVEKLQSSITLDLLGVLGARSMKDYKLASKFLREASESLRKLENPNQNCNPPLQIRTNESTQIPLLIDAYIRRAEAYQAQEEFIRAAMDLETAAKLLLEL